MTDYGKEGIRLANEILNIDLKESYIENIKAGRTITPDEMFRILEVVECLLIPKSASPEGTLKMVKYSEERFK